MFQQMNMLIIVIILCITMININKSESISMDREKRFLSLSTCNLPCLTEGNNCFNGGICRNHKCNCSTPNLPSCSGLPCATAGNKCFFGGVCTLCKEGKRCKK